jgi:hypothetical protein
VQFAGQKLVWVGDKQRQCWHCGEIFPTRKSKNAHLQHCKKRAVLRLIKIDNYLFFIRCNPQKRRLRALEHIIVKYGGSAKKLIVGALYYAKYMREIIDFGVYEIKTPALIQYENGLVSFTPVLKNCTTEERASIQKEIEVLMNKPLPELPERKEHIAQI